MTTNGARVPDETVVPAFAAADDVPARAGVLGVPVFSDLTSPAGAGAQVDASYLRQRRFEGRAGQVQAVLADDGTTVVAVGVGEKGSVSNDDLRRAAAALARQAGRATHVATTLVAAVSGDGARADGARAVVEGLGLGSYIYAGAPKRKQESNGSRPGRYTVVGASAADIRRGTASVEATCRARDWVNRPPRDLTPRELARLTAAAARAVGVKVDIWDEARIEREGLGGLTGVASGASEPPRLIRLEYRAGGAGRRGSARAGARSGRGPTVHLVGKGITFDSGGLSLKPPAGMMTMKCDMGGAAAVINATLGLARVGAATDVVCWAAATENMPSGTAIHPGDVLTARNGKTIEVLNTDAEGRLVLADALSLAVEDQADAIIDVATLTGAQRVALGDGVAAVMGTDADLVRRVVAAGAVAGEPFWELPLVGSYRKMLDSEVADLKNVASGGAAGTIIAGLFLKDFVGDVPWAHLDIAGPAFLDSDDGWLTKGATGWGTRTLMELVRAW
jgi:leucyl aminopeptidase